MLVSLLVMKLDHIEPTLYRSEIAEADRSRFYERIVSLLFEEDGTIQ